MDPSTELANLEKDNGERINALIQQGVQLQPGTFELIQITTYLEFLITRLHGDYPGRRSDAAVAKGLYVSALDEAKTMFAEKCAEVITQLEQAARRAKIVNGRFPQKGQP